MEETSREPSPKMQVRMGVDNMVRMVKITATPAVVEEMRKSFVIDENKYDWHKCEDSEKMKMIIQKTNSG